MDNKEIIINDTKYIFDKKRWTWGNAKKAQKNFTKGQKFDAQGGLLVENIDEVFDNQSGNYEFAIKICFNISDSVDFDEIDMNTMQEAIDIIDEEEILKREKTKNSKGKNK